MQQKKFQTIRKIMTFSKNNFIIMNILTDFQNHDKIKKIRKSWLSGNSVQIFQKIAENYCRCLLLSIGQVWLLLSCDSKDIYILKCTLPHIVTLIMSQIF